MLAQDLNEKAIFAVAISIPVKEAREIYLDQVCKDNRDLRSRVELLLRMQEEEPEFLETPAQHVVATIALANSDSATGQFIGPYKIREKIAEGGMGAVYVAEQTEPVRRKVALKVIRPGMAGPDVVARFEAERQALAMMDHPNIARVLDGGATEEELPYFVMELVQGLPINEYCDQKRLTIRQRLELFVGVCRAVQHAHQKGIIHRDLKPSNILVAEIDGVAVPKVIDFGIAKALHQKLTDQTVYTQFSQMVGTPLYMSPEQAGLGVIDVDTRSDVYSLGAVLYELLTGETPFDRETLKKATFDEMRRIIREDEPKRPSALVSTLAAEAQSTVAQRRHLDARQHRDSLAGELDWLVMKALDKDRNRRYESANALAADIERYLNDKPVEACPPSTAYRLKKYTQRNRGKLLAVSLVGVALLVSAGSLAAWKWDQSRKQRQVAAEVERSTFAARAAMESGDLEMAEKQLAAARVRAESAALTISDLAVLDDEI
ncbi:MAG: serine/threonine protein kinase, partial [bacterium]|nr:serine/threonine protein kinase [bacterium]